MSKLYEKIKAENPDKPLIFVHTPKCAGSYVLPILKNLNISSNGHNQANPDNGIHFTVIRDPISRFESLLNYRLTRKKNMPKPFRYLYNDETITLDEIVNAMSDRVILRFKPYRTLTYWTTNVPILLTINELQPFLHFWGYKYDLNNYKPKNVSFKTRGVLNTENRQRIANLFHDDCLLYQNHIQKTI